MTDIRFTAWDTPAGPLLLTASDDGAVRGLHFAAPESARSSWRRDDTGLAGMRAQLDEYFAGARTAFDLPLTLEGSAFERRVWEALQAIPYGTTTTYGELAARLGAPGAARAVGVANSRNPVA